jgi:hypothetical protein
MPVKLKSGFVNYINGLEIAYNSKANYRHCVRWIEEYGSGVLDVVTLQNPQKFDDFINDLAEKYDADAEKIGRLMFNKKRKSDAKAILQLHYLNFLLANENGVARTQKQLDKAGAFQVTNLKDGKEKVLRSIALRRGQRKFRDELVRAYSGTCAITGNSIEDILEAAHISPYNGPSTDHVSNGILLRSDIHVLFDLGLLSIDPTDFSIYCSEQILDEPMYAELSGKKLKIPVAITERPNLGALRSHFDKRVL